MHFTGSYKIGIKMGKIAIFSDHQLHSSSVELMSSGSGQDLGQAQSDSIGFSILGYYLQQVCWGACLPTSFNTKIQLYSSTGRPHGYVVDISAATENTRIRSLVVLALEYC